MTVRTLRLLFGDSIANYIIQRVYQNYGNIGITKLNKRQISMEELMSYLDDYELLVQYGISLN